jgi:hypothetical protein
LRLKIPFATKTSCFVRFFYENKKLNLERESSSLEIASLRSMHDDMSVKPYDNCKMIMVNYADLWLIHSHVASLLNSAKLEPRELKAHSTLLGACTSCPLLRSDLKASPLRLKILSTNLIHFSRYTVLSPPCEACVSLKGKLFHANKENTDLQQEVVYLTSRLEKTVLSEKMIEENLSTVEECATKSTNRLGVGFERCENKDEKSAPKFILSFTYHKEKATIKSTKSQYPSNSKSSFNPKRVARKETLKPRVEAFVCIFCSRAGQLYEFCFRHKRIEKRQFDYARNSYRDEFIDFLPRSYSCALPRTYSRDLPQFSHGSNHHSNGFG